VDDTGLSGAKSISVGDDHACAIVAGGAVACWGLNDDGQLGVPIGGLATQKPVAVAGLSGATAISVGPYYSCAIVAGGAVDCWGRLGPPYAEGSSSESATPISMPGVSGAVAISLGIGHACAIVAGGAVKCWGDNKDGQLGDGTTRSSLTPVSVQGVTGATAIAAGGGYSCVVVVGGAVSCWGRPPHSEPHSAAGVTAAKAIVAGKDSVCVVVAAGTVQCWGDNTDGLLGIDTGTLRSETPVTVAGLSAVVAISGVSDHICSIVSGGEVKCWGSNSDGQLGDGTKTSSWTPVTALKGD
jgi:alpha-tubulin suppressor-like RCC1 family protein